MSTDADCLLDRVGVFRPKQEMVADLGPGEIGFFRRHQEVADTRVGDRSKNARAPKPCPIQTGPARKEGKKKICQFAAVEIPKTPSSQR